MILKEDSNLKNHILGNRELYIKFLKLLKQINENFGSQIIATSIFFNFSNLFIPYVRLKIEGKAAENLKKDLPSTNTVDDVLQMDI